MILVLVAGEMLPFYCAISGCDSRLKLVVRQGRGLVASMGKPLALASVPLSSIVSDFRRSSKGGAFAIELQMAAVDVVCQLMATEVRPSEAGTAAIQQSRGAAWLLAWLPAGLRLAANGFW